MRKERYMTPEMEVTYFEAEDIVTTSLTDGFDEEVGEVLKIFDLDL